MQPASSGGKAGGYVPHTRLREIVGRDTYRIRPAHGTSDRNPIAGTPWM